MQPNYEEMMKKQQQDYQRSRDPFQYGQQVAQRRYSEIMSNLDMQKGATQQSYGDLYSQARQRAVKGQAMGGQTLSGGMAQQGKDYVSALEMQEMGRIGQAQEGAMRDLYSQGQAAFSNAQLEGQQATQMELQNQQAQLGLVQQTQQIVGSDLTEQQKRAQLEALGVNYDDVKPNLEGANRGLLGWKGVFDGEATAGDIVNAVVRTALAAGAIYAFGPVALKLAAKLGGKLLTGKAATAGGALTKTGGLWKTGTAGWKPIVSFFKTKLFPAVANPSVNATFVPRTPLGLPAPTPRPIAGALPFRSAVPLQTPGGGVLIG
jgi:hypothetical protein